MDKHPLQRVHRTHYYDGIEERDNPLPGWWRATFYLCMIFAAVYYVRYQFGGGESIAEEYEASRRAHEARYAAKAAAGALSPEAMEALTRDAKAVGAGKDVFGTRCAVCHGPEGQGGIGPNLTDAAWIHGDGKAAGIFKIVSEGVPAKGMPTWGTILSTGEVQAVVAFVRSLRGTSPANPKPPQGEARPE